MESDFNKKVQSKAQELRKLGAKHKKVAEEVEEPVEKKVEPIEKKEEPVEKKEWPVEKEEPLDVDVAVKSVLGAKLSKGQAEEAGDTTPEPETKDNKDLETKLQELIKQSKEISEFTQHQKKSKKAPKNEVPVSELLKPFDDEKEDQATIAKNKALIKAKKQALMQDEESDKDVQNALNQAKALSQKFDTLHKK